MLRADIMEDGEDGVAQHFYVVINLRRIWLNHTMIVDISSGKPRIKTTRLSSQLICFWGAGAEIIIRSFDEVVGLGRSV